MPLEVIASEDEEFEEEEDKILEEDPFADEVDEDADLDELE